MDFQLNTPVNKSYYSKKVIQILLSVSVFSFLILQLLLLHLFLSTFSSKLFSFSTERNYIFLLCNGVILVIIKTSGLSAPGMEGSKNKDDKRNIHAEAFRNNDNEEKVQNACNKSFTSNSVVLVETKTEITEIIGKESDLTGVGSDDNVTLTAQYEVKSKGENDKLLKMVKKVEEQQIVNIKACDEENAGLLSLEELNKKCEDFIRKMKHGIIIEDRQPIMV